MGIASTNPQALLDACIKSVEYAQSAVVAAHTISGQVVMLTERTSNHISHATAVLDELGLAVSSATILDPLKWRERAVQVNNDSISREDIRSKAVSKLFAKNTNYFSAAIRYIGVHAWTGFVFSSWVRWAVFILFPLIGFILALVSLFGMAEIFHITANRCFGYALCSFLITLIFPVLLSSGSRGAQKLLDTEIPGK